MPRVDVSTSLTSRAFGVLLGLLVLSFFFFPDQAGRNVVLYAAALAAHAFLGRRQALSSAFGQPGGWIVMLLVLSPIVSLAWSSAAGTDEARDLVLAGYCILAIYLGTAGLLQAKPQFADTLAALMLIAGNVAGIGAILYFLADHIPPGGRLAGLWGIDNPVHASVLLLGSTLPVLSRVLRNYASPLWVLGFAGPLCFVVLAGARTAAAAYLLVVVTVAAVRRLRAVVWVLSGALAVVGSAIALLGTEVVAEVWLARGLSFRGVIWEQVWEAYRACNPAVGCGIATPLTVEFGGVEGNRAHSIFLATLYHQGLLGLVVFLGGMTWLLWRGLRPKAAAARGWAWMLIYVLFANVTSGDHILVRASLFWPAFWLPVMVIAARCKENYRSEST